MASASPSPIEPSPLPVERGEVEALRSNAASWALDISGVRSVIASVAAGSARPDWVETMLAGVRIADVNQRAVYLVGPYVGSEQMIGRPITMYWPHESRPALAALITAAVTAGPGAAPSRRAVTSLAFVDPVLAVWADENDARADIVRVSISGTPIDERSSWSLRASEERYRNLIHHLPVALLQVDSRPLTAIFANLRLEGITDIAAYLDATPELSVRARESVQVTDANWNAAQLFGAESAGQLVGSVDYLFAAAPEAIKSVLAAHFDGRRSHSTVMKLRTFDGRLRDVELSVTYPTPPERLDVTLLSIEDITDRLRTEAQLRQLQADYSRAARITMLGELATSIAHEVNQPLSAIVTNAETSLRWLARDEPNLDKVGQLTARIAESGRRASDIVQRIRGMAARRAPERVPIDLNAVVDEALVFVRHEIESRAIALSTDLATGIPQVIGDRVQLQQVIVNLLINAVQAQAGAGRIELGTTADEGAVVFTIHDGGPGIEADDLERVFGSFFTTKDDGIGIGLALCQSIIAAHGGTITAANHPEGGAVFRFSLPVAA